MTLVNQHESGAPLPCCVRNEAMECTMTNHAIVWRFRRQVMLEAARLGNVSEACRWAGVSRTTYYRWLGRYLAYGSDGLAPKQGRPPRQPRRLSLQTERPLWPTLWPIPHTARSASPTSLAASATAACGWRA